MRPSGRRMHTSFGPGRSLHSPARARIAGLLVAIPSVFGYNILLASTKRLVTELENYASSLADRIELESD